MSSSEVAFTCDGAGNSNVRAWNLETGGLVATFAGGVSQQRSLSFIRGDYILSSQQDKTAFNLWSFRQYDQVKKKFAAPGRVRAMDVSPCGSICVASIDSELFIWEIQTGCLLGTIKAHYQPIVAVKFTADGTRFLSASMDSVVCVWPLSILECVQYNEVVEPEMTFRDHTQAITDLAIRGDLVATCSISGLLAVHSLKTGCLEYKRNIGKSIESIAIKPDCSAVFVGLREGRIVRLSLSDDKELEFKGHAGPVRCLSTSTHLLLSGSDDCTARIWDADHGHLLQTLRHDGPVTNVRIAVFPAGAYDKSKAPLIAIRNFQRTVDHPRSLRSTYEINEASKSPGDPTFFTDSGFEDNSQLDEAQERLKQAAVANNNMINFLLSNV